MYIGAVNGTTMSMAVYSLANPEKPIFLRKLNDDYPGINFVHDMRVRNDTVYASCGYQGLFIYLYDTIANKFKLINALTSYPNQGYNHSSALTTNGKTLVFCEEVPRDLTVKVLDISDISNISVASSFKSTPGATAHNPYIKDNKFVVIAYYQDGLQIFDIRNPKQPFRTGFFDTDTIDGIKNNYNISGYAYHGNWGAYIDLPSGLILASDMQNGLYVLNADLALGIADNKNPNNISLVLFPNPANDQVTLRFNLKTTETILYEVFDITGKKVFSATQNESAGIVDKSIPTAALAKGIYSIKLSGKEIFSATKFVKN
jgi:hypothetical protein